MLTAFMIAEHSLTSAMVLQSQIADSREGFGALQTEVQRERSMDYVVQKLAVICPEAILEHTRNMTPMVPRARLARARSLTCTRAPTKPLAMNVGNESMSFTHWVFLMLYLCLSHRLYLHLNTFACLPVCFPFQSTINPGYLKRFCVSLKTRVAQKMCGFLESQLKGCGQKHFPKMVNYIKCPS